MKRIIALAISTFTFFALHGQVQLPLTQDFETSVPPSGWTQVFESGTRNWTQNEGGFTPVGTTYGYPPFSHGGTYNAFFHTNTVGHKTKLITPNIDMQSVTKPVLQFYEARVRRLQADELRVFFRISPQDPWVPLESYLDESPEWTYREIVLPFKNDTPEDDTLRTNTFQIAFEATSQSGYGVCIDDVNLYESALIPLYVDKVDVRATSIDIASGTTINPIGYTNVNVKGNDGTLTLSSTALNYTGTNINDIENVRLYYTIDSTFRKSSPVLGDLSIDGNTISFTNISRDLITGDNFIWYAVDIDVNAEHENEVKFSVSPNSMSIGTYTYPGIQITPSGKNIIQRSIVMYDFESGNGWQLDPEEYWEIGYNTGGGRNDPTGPYDGNNALVTNLEGNYPLGVTEPIHAVSESVDATYYQNIYIFFRRWLNTNYQHNMFLSYSTDENQTWTTLWQNYNAAILDNNWKHINYNTFVSREENLSARFSIGTNTSTLAYGGWNIDNFAITGEFIHSDVGVKSLVTPIQACGLTNQEEVKVLVRNYGGAAVNTPFDVGYSLNDGVSYIREEFNMLINSEADEVGNYEIEFTFATKADFSTPGLKKLKFKTFLEGDQDNSNNEYSKSLYVFPTVVYPYQTSFETSNSHWYPSGINSSWQWGTPNGTFINHASNGSRVWATGLSQNYKNEEFSYLESPCFDLSTAEYPVFAFDYIMQIDEGEDGMMIEYSIDGGLTWSTLPEDENYASNWYDTETVTSLGASGWSLNTTDYVTAKTLLPSNTIGVNGVKFRFVFASDVLDAYEGVAIDLIKVYELPYDLGISLLVSPTDDCEIGNNVNLELQIENLGYRPLPTSSEIPIGVKLNNGTLKTETATYTGGSPLAQSSTFNHITTNTFNIYNAGVYNVTAYTNLAIEDNRLNDTLKTTVEVYGMPGYTLGPDIGTMQPDTVVLDAGSGYTSYTWYKQNVSEGWDVVGTNQTYALPFEGWGIYRVDIENSQSCTATATIQVAESDKDVGVSEILNLTSECEQPTPISPQVKIKSFNTATFDGTEVIPIVVKVNDEVILTEELTPENEWGGTAGIERTFTFAGTIDLSEAETYNISIYTNLSKDLNKTNDTTSITINTWGEPDVETFVETQTSPSVFEEITDQIITTRADTLVFKATSGFASYTWEQQIKGETTWTLCSNDETFALSSITNNLPSAYYRITAVANYSCGTDIDTITVNTADLAITSILSPTDPMCETTDPTPLRITIKNVGHETFLNGSQIQVNANTPFGNQNETITLNQDLLNNQELVYTFPQTIQFPVGEHYVFFSIESDNDPNPDNDSESITSNVYPSPSVSIEPDSLFRIFGPYESYTITPTYSEDVTSYLWNDGTEDPEYFFWGIPPYIDYIVIAKNEYNCAATDTIVIISSDLNLTNISSPSNECELDDNTPIVFTLYNNGNQIYQMGTELYVSVYLDGNLETVETVTLPINIEPQTSHTVTLNHQLNLAGVDYATVQVDVASNIIEVYDENNSRNKTVYSLGYPDITLGEDRVVFDWEEVLDPGYFDTYLWQDGSTDRTFAATESGFYHVTVTDFTGCEGYAEVNLTFYIVDIEINDIVSPISGCELGSDVPVTITFKNSGNYAFDAGTTLNLGFSLGETNYSEELILDQPFDIDDELTVTLGQTVDLTETTTHNMHIWVEVENDMIPENSNIAYPVDSYPPVDFSLNLPDEIFSYGPITLDAGAGYVSYLWQDGSSEQTYFANETGLYHVTVTDANGCTGYDQVYITFNKSDINIAEVVTPASEQCRFPNMPIEITIKNERDAAIAAGAEFTMNCTVGFDTPMEIVETMILTENLDVNEEVTFVFDQTLNLSPNTTYDLSFRIDYDGVDGNTYQHTSIVYPTPYVDLGPEIAYVEFPYTLVAGVGGVTYLWSTGSTASSIETYQPGEYWIRVTNEYGCSASDTIILSDGSSVHEIPGTGSSVNIYPNPVSDVLTIEVDALGNKEFVVELISPIGQLLHNSTINTFERTVGEINVQRYPSGIYLLRVSSQGKWVTLKIVID